MHTLSPRSAATVTHVERNASTYICPTCDLGCTPPLVRRRAGALLVSCPGCRAEFAPPKLAHACPAAPLVMVIVVTASAPRTSRLLRLWWTLCRAIERRLARGAA